MTDSATTNLPTATDPVVSPPEDLASLVREHPGLLIAGGIAIGLLVGAMLPRRVGGKLTDRAVALAGVAGEVGLALSQQARHRAEDATREGREKLADLSASASKAGLRAAKNASAASADLRDTGIKLARKAVEFAARARG